MSTSAIYPTGIAPALGHLNSSNNDIEIYVEDTSSKNVWRSILQNFLPEGTKFNDPIRLGGREKVLEECSNDQASDSRKKLYIIDGDLDIIRCKSKPTLKHLYRLRSYCIENYLLNEASLIEASTTLDPNCSREEAKIKLDLSAWEINNKQNLQDIFVCYATANKFAEEHQTIGYHGSRLAKSHPSNDNICPDKSFERIFSLYRKFVTRSNVEYIKNYRTNLKNNCSSMSVFRFVSGKDYLLPLLSSRLRNKLKHSVSNDILTVILAKSTPKSVDPYLVRRLRKILNG